MQKPGITLSNAHHQDNLVVSMVFEKDATLINQVKTLPGARWSQSQMFWYIPKEQLNLSMVFSVLQPLAYLDYRAPGASTKYRKNESVDQNSQKHAVAIPVVHGDLPEQKHYADKTKSVFLECFADFDKIFPVKRVTDIVNERKRKLFNSKENIIRNHKNPTTE